MDLNLWPAWKSGTLRNLCTVVWPTPEPDSPNDIAQNDVRANGLGSILLHCTKTTNQIQQKCPDEKRAKKTEVKEREAGKLKVISNARRRQIYLNRFPFYTEKELQEKKNRHAMHLLEYDQTMTAFGCHPNIWEAANFIHTQYDNCYYRCQHQNKLNKIRPYNGSAQINQTNIFPIRKICTTIFATPASERKKK